MRTIVLNGVFVLAYLLILLVKPGRQTEHAYPRNERGITEL